MQVCTTLSLHQPSAHPGRSLPRYPAIVSVFTVNRTIMVRGIALIPLFLVYTLSRTERMKAKQAFCAGGTGRMGHCQASPGR